MAQHYGKLQRVSVDDPGRRRPCLTPSQPQTTDSSNGDQDPRMRAHHPLGPRSSINRSLVQGQPRIFASMNTGTDFQQEPVALKQGQPRIFATGNGQDPQPWNTNGPQPSPGYTRGAHPQQEPPTVNNSRTVDIKGKSIDRSGTDQMQGYQQQQQQPWKPSDQRGDQTLPRSQTGETAIRTMYTEAMSPATQYRTNLEKGKDRNRPSGNGPSANRSIETQPFLPSSNRQPTRRATKHHVEPPPPAPLRKDSSGSSNEHQQRSMGSRGHSVDQHQPLNLNGENVASKLSRRQSLYSPVVAVTTNLPDVDSPNEPPISPRTSKSFAQRSDSVQREPARYHSPPAPSLFTMESSPPTANGYPNGDINTPSREPVQNRDPRRQPVTRNTQNSTTSLSTQDSGGKPSLTSNASVSSERERDRNSVVAEPQPSRNRPHKSAQPPRLDKNQTSPPPANNKSPERFRASVAPANRGSQMDSFYGGDASGAGMKQPNTRNGEEASDNGIEEEEPSFYPLELHLLHPQLLRTLLQYMTFYDWCILQAVNKNLRSQLSHVKELKEEVLERYLSTIGYTRWLWEEDEPLKISLRVKSSCLSSVVVLTSVCRISANICVVFHYRPTSTPGSRTTTCKRGLPPCKRRRD